MKYTPSRHVMYPCGAYLQDDLTHEGADYARVVVFMSSVKEVAVHIL